MCLWDTWNEGTILKYPVLGMCQSEPSLVHALNQPCQICFSFLQILHHLQVEIFSCVTTHACVQFWGQGPWVYFCFGQHRARMSNACIEDITQPFECTIGDPMGLVLLPVFSNTVVAWDSCTHSACLINCCLQSCCSFCVLFLLARIKKSKQRSFIVLFWGNLNWLNMDARYKPTF